MGQRLASAYSRRSGVILSDGDRPSERRSPAAERQNSPWRFLTFLLLLVLVAASLAGSNPRHELHSQAIHDSSWESSPVATLLGKSVIESAVSEYHSVVVASFTTVGEQVVTIGMFGHVWALN
jgi:hypothetical protein